MELGKDCMYPYPSYRQTARREFATPPGRHQEITASARADAGQLLVLAAPRTACASAPKDFQ
jgi:hypothetical protein